MTLGAGPSAWSVLREWQPSPGNCSRYSGWVGVSIEYTLVTVTAFPDLVLAPV